MILGVRPFHSPAGWNRVSYTIMSLLLGDTGDINHTHLHSIALVYSSTMIFYKLHDLNKYNE
jgi:hypothetical protein